MRSPNGGGFGAFNSRFGWGSLGVEPGTGLSNDIVKQFYVDYRVNNVYNLGAAHAVSVDEFLPPEDAYWHWCTMEYNLLGDPELPMWSTHASAMTVSHTSTISGPGNVTVTVTGTSGGLSGARVCLQKGDWQTGEVYEVPRPTPRARPPSRSLRPRTGTSTSLSGPATTTPTRARSRSASSASRVSRAK